ncbi:isocitrate lyase/phosphoenolpyruvate mutase family protein [Ruegeria sp. 2012CJ41-6]|uniref:Isocitrate lyase/phosphoenolpyruvate mutase family protein n=1 Tax=Ruegeria spongiae TaxID=2942209 RepID=A0ABT0Q5Y9_9RHOB|nr:isocitrate lyase/phosphoenolpyruvate mutase family protein [Ruegeria spongiae]MCL6284314.1 isocitrate lyase/phosphoenolpyruvate mutase family protein [Ruegeria spongiae]
MEQAGKYERLRALHGGEAAFVLPNAWDAGSARLLTSLGFGALATTSAGYAFSVGKRDSAAGLSRAEILQNAAQIVAATDLPVSGDLEDGFGATPEACARTIAMASQIGLVGGTIEDATGDPDAPIYDISHATDRIRAAVEAARGQNFLLTARAENFICGRPDLADTIRRLQAFEEAGADVLYAPGLPDLETIRTVCQSVGRPVNVVMGLSSLACSVTDLSKAGVARISVGGSFARAAIGAMMRAAREVQEQGTFTYSQEAIPDGVVRQVMLQTRDPQREE